MTRSIAVRVPGSSANLGAGFDVLGMALDLFVDVGFGDPPDDARRIDRHHPAVKAYAAAGGALAPDVPLWIRSSIPMGRGLGFSGAVRVAGAALAVAAESADPGSGVTAARESILGVAAALERHGDNAAASVLGGVVAWVEGRAIPLRVGPQVGSAAVVVWIPGVTTSTDHSRGTLPGTVARADAVVNLGRVAQFVVAIEQDDPLLLVGATADRLHQTTRLAAVAEAAAALDAGVAAGAWCGWLSGSGPTVAFLAADGQAAAVAASLPAGAQVKRARIEQHGVRVLDASTLG